MQMQMPLMQQGGSLKKKNNLEYLSDSKVNTENFFFRQKNQKKKL